MTRSHSIHCSPSLLVLLPMLGCADRTREAPNHSVQLLELADRIRIEVHSQLFSEYIFRGASKPYLYPILAADGTAFTRDWPMIDKVDFARDHPHHRSLWYGHCLVNGHDFWREQEGTGRIVHESVTTLENGNQGTIHATNRWELPDGKVICTDERTIRVHSANHVPVLDFEITLHASHGPLILGDTEEGSMAIRVHEQMPVTLRRGDLSTPGPGRIVNSNDDENIAAWGKRAEWCAYTGTVDGRQVGIAIFDHPGCETKFF